MITLFKIGGNVIDKEESLQAFLQSFLQVQGAKLLVHGGGVMATQLAEKLGIPVIIHEGRRITDLETLKIATMVYAGWINKTLVAALENNGCAAIGLSGADNHLLRSTRRSPQPIDFGYVGDLDAEGVNVHLLQHLLRMGLCPVISSISCDQQGQLLNTNADTVAQSVACALLKYYAVRIIFVFDKEGVLYPNSTTAIPLLSKKQYLELKAQQIVNGGMIPKLDNAFAALEKGIEEVYIGKTKLLL